MPPPQQSMTTDRDDNEPSMPSKTLPPRAVEIPYRSSTLFAVVLSVTSPLVAVLYTLLPPLPHTPREHSPRALQQPTNQCLINITDTNSNQLPSEPSTWTAIATSLLIALCIALACLALYELYRRDPIVGKYVYDRKRLLQPGRTPPPLMLSRSLWRGDDGKRHRCWRFRVRPALLELFFLTLDETYVRYSARADEARRQRERRGLSTYCRRGCYHDNCCNELRVSHDDDEEEYVDDDGYVYYPGFNHELGFVHTGENHYEIPRFSPRNAAASSSPRSSGGRFEGSGGASLVTLGERKFKRSIEDLYPEDFRAALQATKQSQASRSLEVGHVCDEESGNGTEGSLFASAVEEMEPVCRGITRNLQPVQVDEDPNDDDANHHDRVVDDALVPGSSADQQPLKYPYRLVTFFLPPGFHNWSTALGFLGEFCFLPKFSRRVAKARGALFGTGSQNSALSKSQRIKVHDDFIVLSPAEEELLRCAGLDTYLLIRFARFGFDVCFYPFLFACVTVIPVYITCVPRSLFQAANGEIMASATILIDGFFSLTINRIEPGSSKMYWIIVFTFFLYFFVLRRLWLEWEIFIKLRHRFLSNGDQNFHDNPIYLKKVMTYWVGSVTVDGLSQTLIFARILVCGSFGIRLSWNAFQVRNATIRSSCSSSI
ncbi:hypothetical protein ACHAWX_007265 [Stephanocyclus meneghinianus]